MTSRRLAIISVARCHAAALVAALLLASVPRIASAQRPSEPRYHTASYTSPVGPVVVLGLHRWTLAMLQDSLAARQPGLALHDAACQVVLRRELGFADALVNHLQWQDGPDAPTRSILVIKVVEPKDSARVQWEHAARDSFTVLRPDYAPLILAATDTGGALWIGRLFFPLQLYGDTARQREALEGAPPAARADADRMWGFLATHRDEADRRRALAILRRDGSYANRLVAVAVLANFPAQDSTWYALVEALRDRNESVRTAAQLVLEHAPARRIDWARESATLRLLLGGTNVSASELVFGLLARTGLDPALGRSLLAGNAEWLLAHLEAPYPSGPSAAHQLLVQLNDGHDLGRRADAWRSWLARAR